MRISDWSSDVCSSDLPPVSQWRLSKDAAYVHVTANETIHGVEFRPEWGALPDPGSVPLFADFSSSIASEPLDVSRYGLVYAGAQKTLGPVGITVVIVRRHLPERAGQPPADNLNYHSHAEAGPRPNNPPPYNRHLPGR